MKPYLSVSKDALLKNLSTLQTATESKIMAVVKCNGYGLGIAEYAHLLSNEGVYLFGVARAEEAFVLRESGITGGILLLEPFNEIELPWLLSNNVSLSIVSAAQAELLFAAEEETGLRGGAHIRFDTGHGVFGFLPGQFEENLPLFEKLNIEGTYTHFSLNSGKPLVSVRKQCQMYRDGVAFLRDNGIEPGILHAAASSTFFMDNEFHFDMVRIGSAMLGRVQNGQAHGLEQVGEFCAPITEVRELPAGWPIGYSGAFVTDKPMRVAVTALGSGDGLAVEKGRDCFRFVDILRYIKKDISLHKKFLPAWVGDKKTRILGIISLCNSVIDITDIDAAVGDIVRMPVNPLRADPDIERVFS